MDNIVQQNNIFSFPQAEMKHYADCAAVVGDLEPSEPVFCIRPHVLEQTARDFVSAFPGRTLYAVKCNAEPEFLHALWRGGVRHFDVASLPEVELLRRELPEASLYFMHPVKSRRAIRESFHLHGLRHFVLDHGDELSKIREETGNSSETVMVVRLETSVNMAELDLSGKFGANIYETAALLDRAAKLGHKVAIAFHVGSQCLKPEAYALSLHNVKQVLERTDAEIEFIDIGGGFPVPYLGVEPPPLSDYVDCITATTKALGLDGIPLWSEPGRALVAAGASYLTRVELKRGNMLYLNDGLFGALSDHRFKEYKSPMRVWHGVNPAAGRMQNFGIFGPTCDSYDHFKGKYRLPQDVAEGDWIEFGQMGAYSFSLRTDFNGFCPTRKVVVADEAFLPDLYPVRLARAA